MSDYGLVANGCLAHHFWHVRYLGTAILHSAKLLPSILNNYAQFKLVANCSWFWILMKIVFSVKFFLVILSVVKWPIIIFFTKHMGLDGSTHEPHNINYIRGIINYFFKIFRQICLLYFNYISFSILLLQRTPSSVKHSQLIGI